MMMRGRNPKLPILIGRFVDDEAGATAIEYGLIVSLIFLAIMAAVNGFANESQNMYSEIEDALVN